jgi:hypothetical protein
VRIIRPDSTHSALVIPSSERHHGRGEEISFRSSGHAFLNRSNFYTLIQREPELGIRAIELLGERLSFYEQRIADMGLTKVPARLASLILQLVETEGLATGKGRYRLSTHYTHEQLALMVGAKRVAVSRAMKGLREAGLWRPGAGTSWSRTPTRSRGSRTRWLEVAA